MSADVEALDPVFKALADPTRRRILDLLRQAPRTTGDLADQFPMSRYGVMKHLEQLTDAGLVTVRRVGRTRWNHLNAIPLQRISRRWMGPYEALWSQKLLRLEQVVSPPVIAPSRQGEVVMPIAPSMTETVQVYVIAQELTFEASPEKVFTSLTSDIGRWWGPPHAFSEAPLDIVLEPFAGGRFMELMPDGGSALFCHVTRFQPDSVLELRGHMAMSAPCSGVMLFELAGDGDATRLKFTHTFMGPVGEEMQAGYTEGWTLILDTRLRAWIERGEALGARR